MSETLVFVSAVDPIEPWREALQALLPDVHVRTPEEISSNDRVHYALVWKPPTGLLSRYPDLKLVTILGAGADALAGRADLPDIPLTRLSDPEMARMMTHYVLFAVLRYARDIPVFEAAQRAGKWHYVHPREARSVRVGILGLGELGGAAALELARQGFAVEGWSRRPKSLAGVVCHAGADALGPFLARADILVVMLPLTPHTHHLLGASQLAALPKGAHIVNVSRGAIIEEAALLAALQSNHLSGATLDVFQTEPLPQDHPFWTMTNVLVTPHLASVAIPGSAARQVADNINRVRAGQAPAHMIDLTQGY